MPYGRLQTPCRGHCRVNKYWMQCKAKLKYTHPENVWGHMAQDTHELSKWVDVGHTASWGSFAVIGDQSAARKG